MCGEDDMCGEDVVMVIILGTFILGPILLIALLVSGNNEVFIPLLALDFFVSFMTICIGSALYDP